MKIIYNQANLIPTTARWRLNDRKTQARRKRLQKTNPFSRTTRTRMTMKTTTNLTERVAPETKATRTTYTSLKTVVCSTARAKKRLTKLRWAARAESR